VPPRHPGGVHAELCQRRIGCALAEESGDTHLRYAIYGSHFSTVSEGFPASCGREPNFKFLLRVFAPPDKLHMDVIRGDNHPPSEQLVAL